jgi:hypothetical protein
MKENPSAFFIPHPSSFNLAVTYTVGEPQSAIQPET